jgi:hypothetical protein
MALQADAFTSLNEQIRLQSVGADCGQSFISLKDIVDSSLASLEVDANSKLRTALAAQNATNEKLEGLLLSTQEETLNDIAEFVGIEDFSDFKDPITIAAESAGSLVDFPELFGAISATSTGILGSVGATTGILDPENANQLTKNVLNYGKTGGCGGGLEGASAVWGATLTGYSTAIQSKIDKLSNDVTKFANTLRKFGKKLGSSVNPEPGQKPTGLIDDSDKGTIADGLLGIGLQTFEFAIRQEAFILKDMMRVAKKLRDALNDMRPSDYKLDHAQLTNTAKQLLLVAEANLATVNDSLSRGGALPRVNYDFAKEKVEIARQLLKLDTGDSWKDVYKVVPSKRALKVVYYMAHLQLLIKTFEKIAERNQERNTNFNAYKTEFEAKTSGIDYLYGPIVNLARCQIKKVVADMNATMRQDKLVSYLLKEKKWYAQLSIIRGILKSVKELDRVKRQLSRDITIDGKKIADGEKLFKIDFDMGQVTSGYIGSTSAAEVIADAKRFLEIANQKLHKNIPAKEVVTKIPAAPAAELTLGTTSESPGTKVFLPAKPARSVTVSYIDTFYLQFEYRITKYMSERKNFSGSLLADTFGKLLPEGLQGALSDLTSKIGPLQDALNKIGEAGEYISGAQQFLTLLDENGFDLAAKGLREGDLRQFFDANAISANLASQIGDVTGIAIDCAIKKQDYTKAAQLQKLADKSGRDQRSRMLAYNILYASDEQYAQILLSTYYPELNL